LCNIICATFLSYLPVPTSANGSAAGAAQGRMTAMSVDGTRAHLRGPGDLPPLVEQAARTAQRLGFPHSCRPEHGRLLRALAAGARLIGETGTGCGVGLAWLVSGMPSGARAASVEQDPTRARAAAGLFADLAPAVTVECADWTAIAGHGPFDLLVLDGGGQGKAGPGDPPADPARLLQPGGLVVIDDFTPSGGRPPVHDGRPDEARLHWLDHPALRTVEVPLAPDLAVLIGTRRAAAA
jgi:predicted O-methyltransferase YrrM